MHPMFLILALVCAFISGVLIGIFVKESEESVVGTFILNTGETTKEIFELHFDKDLDEFQNKRYVSFELKKR